MQAIIFTGIQAAGKSSFYRDRFFRTHVRISLDMLKTRHRERLFLDACIKAKQPFVVDNTNPTAADRSLYIAAAKATGFEVIGYYFRSQAAECLARNARRPEEERVPEKGILGACGRLEIPSLDEGFDELWYVRIEDDRFAVEEWQDEV